MKLGLIHIRENKKLEIYQVFVLMDLSIQAPCIVLLTRFKKIKLFQYESGRIVRKKSDYCPTFLILRYTKSTPPCKIKVTKPNQKGNECLMFKNYTINQTTLPLDME